MNIEKTNIKLLIVIGLIVTTVLSTTYALLYYQAESSTASSQAGCFEVSYEGTILSSNALISTTDYTQGYHAQVELGKASTCKIYTEASIYLYTDTNITAPITTNASLKYKVLSDGTELSSGTINATGDLLLKSGLVLTDTAKTYDIYIWIDKSTSKGDFHGTTYSGNIYAMSEQTSTIKQ